MKNKKLSPLAGIFSNAEPSNLGTRANGVVKKNSSIQDFVPYEEALALKELGFGEPCLKFYVAGKLILGLDAQNGDTNSELNQYDPLYVSAPTFSQAFRWFREKYEFDINIRGAYFRASYVIGIPKNINYNSADGIPLVVEWDYVIDESGKSKTYEESELACLRKLIEIVKTKS